MNVFVPSGTSGGTEPTASGSYELIDTPPLIDEEGSYHAAKLWKLTNENNADYDWYAFTIVILQEDDDLSWDFAHFWVIAWERDAGIPLEVEWDPGTQETGGSGFPMSVSVGTGGVSLSVSWTHDWAFDFEIHHREAQDATDPIWQGWIHHERGETATSWDWDYDWNKISFAATFRMSQDATKGVHLGSQIKWKDPWAWDDCWYPCHMEGTSCCEYYALPDNNPPATECEVDEARESARVSETTRESAGVNEASRTSARTTACANTNDSLVPPLVPEIGDDPPDKILETLDLCGLAPDTIEKVVNSGPIEHAEVLKVRSCFVGAQLRTPLWN